MKLNFTIICFSSLLFAFQNPVRAQLIPDRTLEPESSRVVPVSQNRVNIEGGATRGTNLFHSFQEFNVNPGREVYFNNAPGITNIINRVTGRNISNIFGTLGVNGNANLYLINPNGILFGDRAFLDIRGTFTGTTADGIKLGNNAVFSAVDPASSNLLAVEPGALFVNQIRKEQRAIVNQGNLEINPGANITLSGDSIENSGAIEALSGNVFLEATNGNINTGNIDVSSPTVNEEAIDNGGDINLKASKDIVINSDEVVITTGILAGNINIEANNSFRILNGGRIRNITQSPKTGGGNFNISAPTIEIIGVNPDNGVFSALTFINNGKNAALTVNTNSLRLIDGGAILSGNFRNVGVGGSVDISAKTIEVVGVDPVNGNPPSLIAQNANNGILKIKTDSLIVLDGGQIGTSNFRNGGGGDLIINSQKIELAGINSITNESTSGLFSNAFGNTTGDGGKIDINTKKLIVRNRATINVSNFSSNSRIEPGQGRAGNINIKAEEITLNRGLITARGNIRGGGDITIDSSKFLFLENQSQITTDVGQTAEFPGGNLTINSPIIIANPNNNKITARAVTSRGGNININTSAIFGYPQLLTIDASSSLGINGTINIVGVSNEINRSTVQPQANTLSSETPPKLDNCPLDLTTTIAEEKIIPASIGFCRTKNGTLVIY